MLTETEEPVMCFAMTEDLLAVGYEDEYVQLYRTSGPATAVNEAISSSVAAQVNCLCFYRDKGRLRLIVCQNTTQESMLGACSLSPPTRSFVRPEGSLRSGLGQAALPAHGA